jgi:hypothetical protein
VYHVGRVAPAIQTLLQGIGQNAVRLPNFVVPRVVHAACRGSYGMRLSTVRLLAHGKVAQQQREMVSFCRQVHSNASALAGLLSQ